MKKSTRQRVASFLCLVVLLPLLPFACLQWTLEQTAGVIEWAFSKRWLARTLLRATDRIEVAFGVDADTEYREWQEWRRKSTSITRSAS